MTIIRDGLSGDTAAVDGTNRLNTHTVQESEIQEAVEIGNAYNINTGLISISGTSDSGLLYFKNNQEEDFVIDSIAFGSTDGDRADIGLVTIIKNPTGGDVISTENPVDMNENRNFGSSKTLGNSFAYKGSDGGTLTGGTDVGIFTQSDNGRLFATVDFELPKGASIGIKYDPNLASGTVSVYCALIGHLKRAR